MDPGGRRRWVRDGWCYTAAAAQGEAPLGRDRPLVPLGAGVTVTAWGQKSQRHLSNCVSSISSKKDHSKFNWEIMHREQGETDKESSFTWQKEVLLDSTTCSHCGKDLPRSTKGKCNQINICACVCVRVCVCISKPWWIRRCVNDGQAWQAVLIETLPLSGPGPLIWWRQRQRQRAGGWWCVCVCVLGGSRSPDHRSNEGSGSLSPQFCPAMLGRAATLSDSNPYPRGTDRWIMALSSACVDTTAQPKGVCDLVCMWQSVYVWLCAFLCSHLPQLFSSIT